MIKQSRSQLLHHRLEALKQGVERFGAGSLSHRVAEEGADEVAAVIVSLASPVTGYCVGTNVVCDGGMTVRTQY